MEGVCEYGDESASFIRKGHFLTTRMIAKFLRNILYWTYSVRIHSGRDLRLLSRILWSTEIKDLQEMGECLLDWAEYSHREIRTCVTNKIRFV
jgi:hypothetical protein